MCHVGKTKGVLENVSKCHIWYLPSLTEVIVSEQVLSSDNFSIVQLLSEGHGLAEFDLSLPKMLHESAKFGRAQRHCEQEGTV